MRHPLPTPAGSLPKQGPQLTVSGVLSSENPTFPFIVSRHAEVSRHGEDVCRDFKEPREEKKTCFGQTKPAAGLPLLSQLK